MRDRSSDFDQDSYVCIIWTTPSKRRVLRVTIGGNKVAWESKAESGRATLRGGAKGAYVQMCGSILLRPFSPT